MPQATEETSNLDKHHRASPSPTPWAQSWISTAPQTPSPGNFLSSDRPEMQVLSIRAFHLPYPATPGPGGPNNSQKVPRARADLMAN